MKCNCNEKFDICSYKSKVHFITQVPELIRKCHMIMNQLGFHVDINDNFCTFECENPKDFFNDNIDFLVENFSEETQKDIHVFIENEKYELTVNSVFAAKELYVYINFVVDKSFFDILYSKSFTSYFQPIIDMHTNDIYGYEALIRGVMPNGNLIQPDELFKKSTRNNTNFMLDKICRETALKTAAVKRINKKVFINFVPTSIYDPEFCLAETVKWANQLEFDPKSIVFEVVETEKVQNKEHLKDILLYYRSKGFKIALDDVGEGYSSLNMIADIKPDILKIDRNIISHINENEMKESIYKAISQLSFENNITLLAEGVETQAELDKVKELGVDLVQGYHFAKPSSEPVRTLDI